MTTVEHWASLLAWRTPALKWQKNCEKPIVHKPPEHTYFDLAHLYGRLQPNHLNQSITDVLYILILSIFTLGMHFHEYKHVYSYRINLYIGGTVPLSEPGVGYGTLLEPGGKKDTVLDLNPVWVTVLYI